MMLTVYRIEHFRIKQGIAGVYETYIGPFDYEYVWRMDPDIKDRMYEPPGPRDHWWDEYNGGNLQVFGCPSVKALTAWFDDQILTELTRIGYRIAVYSVSREDTMLCPEGRQCSFRWDRAKRIGKRIKYNGEESINYLRSAKAA